MSEPTCDSGAFFQHAATLVALLSSTANRGELDASCVALRGEPAVIPRKEEGIVLSLHVIRVCIFPMFLHTVFNGSLRARVCVFVREWIVCICAGMCFMLQLTFAFCSRRPLVEQQNSDNHLIRSSGRWWRYGCRKVHYRWNFIGSSDCPLARSS